MYKERIKICPEAGMLTEHSGEVYMLLIEQGPSSRESHFGRQAIWLWSSLHSSRRIRKNFHFGPET